MRSLFGIQAQNMSSIQMMCQSTVVESVVVFFLVHWSNSSKITVINELQDFYVLWMVNGSISPQNQSCNI